MNVVNHFIKSFLIIQALEYISVTTVFDILRRHYGIPSQHKPLDGSLKKKTESVTSERKSRKVTKFNDRQGIRNNLTKAEILGIRKEMFALVKIMVAQGTTAVRTHQKYPDHRTCQIYS